MGANTKNRIAEFDDAEPSSPNMRVEVPRPGMLQVVWGRRWWVLMVTVVGVAATVAYLSRQTPIYSSSSSLYVVQRGSPVVQSQGTTPQASIVTQCELVRSAPVLNEVATRPEIRQMKTMAGIDNPVGILQAGIVAAPAGGARGDMIVVSFESPYAGEAAQIVNLVAEAYSRFVTKNRSSNAAEVLTLLQKEKDKRDLELKTLLDRTLNYKRDHGVLSFQGGSGNIILQTLGKLSDALTTTQMELIDAQADFDAMNAAKGDQAALLRLARVLPRGLSADAGRELSINLEQPAQQQATTSKKESVLEQQIALLSSEVEALERKLNTLLQTTTPEHRDVRVTRADIDYLNERIAAKQAELEKQREIEKQGDAEKLKAAGKDGAEAEAKTAEQKRKREQDRQAERERLLVQTYVDSTTHRLTMVKQREAQLTKAFEEQKRQAFDLNATAAEYATLETELRRVERLCDIIDTRIKELNVSEDTGSIAVTVVDVARPSPTPIRPQKTKTMAMGLLVSLMLGVGLALGLDWMDQRIHSVEEVAAIADAPVLGLVPHISQRQTLPERGQHVAHDPTSDVAEAYRTIRTAVYFGVHKREGRGNRLLVTSPAPGDGKTTSTSNLAIAMAKAGQRVVLIDADLRRPTQHKVFELKVRDGVSTVLQGRATVDEVIQHTGIDLLDVIPAGQPPANPSEMLNSQAFSDLVDELATRYDQVLIDSPPVAPVTDARILGAMCDATILVVRAEKSTRKVTEHARESLRSVGTNIVGVIINDVPRRRDRYGYYYGYTYGYRYRQYGYTATAESNGNGNGYANGNGKSNGNGNGNGHGHGHGNGHAVHVGAGQSGGLSQGDSLAEADPTLGPDRKA